MIIDKNVSVTTIACITDAYDSPFPLLCPWQNLAQISTGRCLLVVIWGIRRVPGAVLHGFMRFSIIPDYILIVFIILFIMPSLLILGMILITYAFIIW